MARTAFMWYEKSTLVILLGWQTVKIYCDTLEQYLLLFKNHLQQNWYVEF